MSHSDELLRAAYDLLSQQEVPHKVALDGTNCTSSQLKADIGKHLGLPKHTAPLDLFPDLEVSDVPRYEGLIRAFHRAEVAPFYCIDEPFKIGYLTPDTIPAGTSDNTAALSILERLFKLPDREPRGVHALTLSCCGYSPCRICGDNNHCNELHILVPGLPVVGIPAGYAHTLSHGVLPNPRLYILNEMLDILSKPLTRLEARRV
jgi:hypothetical protein